MRFNDFSASNSKVRDSVDGKCKLALTPFGWHYLSNATCLMRPCLFVFCVVCRAKDHRNSLHDSPILKKACVRQVVLDKWLPLNDAEQLALCERLADYGWEPHRVVLGSKNCHRPQYTGICVNNRGVRFYRIRDFKQYYFNSVPPSSHSRPRTLDAS